MLLLLLWLVHGVQQPPALARLPCHGLARSMAQQALPPLQPLLLLHMHGRHQQLQALEGRRGGGDGQTAWRDRWVLGLGSTQTPINRREWQPAGTWVHNLARRGPEAASEGVSRRALTAWRVSCPCPSVCTARGAGGAWNEATHSRYNLQRPQGNNHVWAQQLWHISVLSTSHLHDVGHHIMALPLQDEAACLPAGLGGARNRSGGWGVPW